MNVFEFVCAGLAALFGRWDYRKHQCKAMLPVWRDYYSCCIRNAGHPGKHRDNSSERWS